jgi:hypothetical protein
MGVLPERRVWNPCQDGHNNFFGNTFEEARGIATQHATNYESVMLHPAQ